MRDAEEKHEPIKHVAKWARDEHEPWTTKRIPNFPHFWAEPLNCLHKIQYATAIECLLCIFVYILNRLLRIIKSDRSLIVVVINIPDRFVFYTRIKYKNVTWRTPYDEVSKQNRTHTLKPQAITCLRSMCATEQRPSHHAAVSLAQRTYCIIFIS